MGFQIKLNKQELLAMVSSEIIGKLGQNITYITIIFKQNVVPLKFHLLENYYFQRLRARDGLITMFLRRFVRKYIIGMLETNLK